MSLREAFPASWPSLHSSVHALLGAEPGSSQQQQHGGGDGEQDGPSSSNGAASNNAADRGVRQFFSHYGSQVVTRTQLGGVVQLRVECRRTTPTPPPTTRTGSALAEKVVSNNLGPSHCGLRSMEELRTELDKEWQVVLFGNTKNNADFKEAYLQARGERYLDLVGGQISAEDFPEEEIFDPHAPLPKEGSVPHSMVVLPPLASSWDRRHWVHSIRIPPSSSSSVGGAGDSANATKAGVVSAWLASLSLETAAPIAFSWEPIADILRHCGTLKCRGLVQGLGEVEETAISSREREIAEITKSNRQKRKDKEQAEAFWYVPDEETEDPGSRTPQTGTGALRAWVSTEVK